MTQPRSILSSSSTEQIGIGAVFVAVVVSVVTKHAPLGFRYSK